MLALKYPLIQCFLVYQLLYENFLIVYFFHTLLVFLQLFVHMDFLLHSNSQASPAGRSATPSWRLHHCTAGTNWFDQAFNCWNSFVGKSTTTFIDHLACCCRCNALHHLKNKAPVNTEDLGMSSDLVVSLDFVDGPIGFVLFFRCAPIDS